MVASFSRPAYVLVTHGSPDPRPGAALQALTVSMAEGLEKAPGDRPQAARPMVRGAELECGDTSLASQLIVIHNEAQESGCDGVVVVPLFLSAGVHAMEDIPEAIAEAKEKLATLGKISDAVTPASPLPIETAPVLGKHPAWSAWMKRYWQENFQASHVPVVVAHGTRRTGGNQKMEGLARSLGARLAFWSIDPKLPETIEAITAQGQNQLTLLPYFLFEGGITDRIAQQLDGAMGPLKAKYPELHITQAKPFGQSTAFADFLIGAYGDQQSTEADAADSRELSLT
ncbi:MAG: sirohydrochlorin chelatase [Cyanophyceae cyanobacterium]|mgnify:CR=1 FL=1